MGMGDGEIIMHGLYSYTNSNHQGRFTSLVKSMAHYLSLVKRLS